MRILIAPDKFKESLGAVAVAENVAAGLRETLPQAEIVLLPLADGGEGTAEAISAAAGGEWHSCQVHDALGKRVTARYATLAKARTTVLEVSEAIGLSRIPPGQRDLLRASSFGVGELLLAAARGNVGKLIVGLGGSATNDGGFGMARALGFRFLADDDELSGGPADLLRLTKIVPPKCLPLPNVIAAADVRNPLLGNNGATRTYGPQKGGTPEQLEILERALAKLADIVTRDLGCDFRERAGAGAAGGLGFGLMSFCGANLRPGFEVVAEAIQLEEKIRGADIVITGEGRLDAQTLEGKAPAGVARLARRFGKKVYAIAGQTEENDELRALFDDIATLANGSVTAAEAIARAPELLRNCARDLGKKLQRS